MDHDPLFKELLREFLPEFMRLFFPEIAAQLDFSRVEYLDKELLTEMPEGVAREVDFLAVVYTFDGQPEIVAVHIEVESWRRGTFPSRFFEYYGILRRRRPHPIIPIVLYLSPGTGGIVFEEYTEEVFGNRYLTFQYHVIGFPELPGDEYVAKNDALAAALSALMRREERPPVDHALTVFDRIIHSDFSDRQKELLSEVLEKYMKLTAEENTAFESRIQQVPEAPRFIGRFRREGMAAGKQETLLKQLQAKFGELPDTVTERVKGITSLDELDEILLRVLFANSLTEMGLLETPAANGSSPH